MLAMVGQLAITGNAIEEDLCHLHIAYGRGNLMKGEN